MEEDGKDLFILSIRESIALKSSRSDIAAQLQLNVFSCNFKDRSITSREDHEMLRALKVDLKSVPYQSVWRREHRKKAKSNKQANAKEIPGIAAFAAEARETMTGEKKRSTKRGKRKRKPKPVPRGAVLPKRLFSLPLV